MDLGRKTEFLDGDELLKAQAHIWKHVFNFINSMALNCAVQLGIPEAINSHGRKPMSLSELVSALQLKPNRSHCIYRLMRLLVHSGFFINQKINRNGHEEDHKKEEEEEEEEEGYVLTSSSRLLLKDNPMSVAPLLLSMLDPKIMEPWLCLSTWFKNQDPTAFHTARGMNLWEYFSTTPELGNCFNEAMAGDASIVTSILLDKHRDVFEGLKSLVDVGGGNGGMTKNIAKAFPHMKCTVLDLPQVVSELKGDYDNLEYVEGDMFHFIPSANAALMKAIMHDWSDEDCVRILKNCKKAITSNGKVMIIDMVMKCQKEDYDSIETQTFYDLLLMTLCGGKERTEKEFVKLFHDAGFTSYKFFPVLGLRSLIELYP